MYKAQIAKYFMVAGMTVAPIIMLPAHGGHEGGYKGAHEGRVGSREGHEGEREHGRSHAYMVREEASHSDMQEHRNHNEINHDNFKGQNRFHDSNENFNYGYHNFDHDSNFDRPNNNEYNVNGGYDVYGPDVIILK
ncbi:MAG: hypothetical protein H0U49_04305 [Parachlamydiaceae bacterium]|nr:hypothetical protein [Parachlamydiaceae bacterium]